LAPFEGLHRRTGYTTLAAVRAAIADFPSAEAGILPLALDDGAQPQGALRSAEKLLADKRVAAIVGPLSPELAAAVTPLQAAAALPWYSPHSIAGSDWAEGLVAAAGSLARRQGAQSLVIAGWTPGWPHLAPSRWAEIAGLPVRLHDDPAAVGPQTAVFWMGSAEDGANYLGELRRAHPAAPFVLGPQGEDPVFAERVLGNGGGLDYTHWTTWTDAGYTAWTVDHSIESPNAYLAYRAASAALQAAAGHSRTAPPSSWVVQLFRYDDRGNSFPAE
jgi:hypothetical protein